MMKRTVWIVSGFLVVVMFAAACVTHSKKKSEERVTLQIHLQTNPAMPESYRRQIIFQKPPITFWVNSVAELTEHDLADVATVPSPGGLQIKLQFNQHGSFVFEQLTGGNRGRYLAVLINAQPVAVIRIRESRSDGQLIFTPNLTDPQIETIVTNLQHTIAIINREENWGITP